jgi:hypothetical protein
LSEVEPILDKLIPTTIVRAAKFSVWNSRFPLSRQRAQQRALDEFYSCPDVGKVRHECIRKTFIKREKLLKSSVTGVDDFDPRVIQGVGDLANCLLGPWMYAYGKHLAAAWNAGHNVTYASGMNAEALGRWMVQCEQEGYDFFTEADFSRYDASISAEALKVEHRVYARMGAGRWAKVVLQQQLIVRGRSSHGHKYKVDGTRCSGDPNTSPGNTKLTVGAAVWCLYKLGITDFRIIALGDDSVIATKARVDPQEFARLMERLGLVAKVKSHLDADYVEFCSGRFWHTVDGRVWGPKIGRVLAKVGYSVAPQHNPRSWLKGVMLGMAQDCAHVPILSVYIDHCLELLKRDKANAQPDDHKFHVAVRHKACDLTYQQFYKVYEMEPYHLDALKADILGVKTLPCLLDHPMYERLVEVDV